MKKPNRWNRIPQRSYSDLSTHIAAQQICSGVQRTTSGRLRYVPQGYEPSYSYPLIVWLCDSNRDEQSFWRWMPIVSDRNYLAMTSRPVGSARLTMQRLNQDIDALMSQFSVHTDRVFLVGVNDASLRGQEIYDRNRSQFAGYFRLNAKADMRKELLSIDGSIMRTIDTAVHPE